MLTFPIRTKEQLTSKVASFDFNIDIEIRDYFRWIFDDRVHPILVCVYPRSAGKTYATFDWMLSRVLADKAVEANALIYTKDISLIKNRFESILNSKYKALRDAGYFRMDQRNGQINIFLNPKDKFPYRVIHTGSYFQKEGGLGTHDKYIVCDEAGNMPRALWDKTLRPIALQDIGSGAQFLLVGTPQGMDNVFYELFDKGQSENPRVKSVRKTCYDLRYPQSTIDFIKETGTESAFRSELLCDFAVSSFYGSIYAPTIEQLERDGQISNDYSYNPKYPVNIAFDLGFNDATVCWFWQYYNDRIFFIDYLEVTNKYFRDIVREDIKPKYQGNYLYCIMPHDSISHHHSGGGSNEINSFDAINEDTSFGVAQAQGWNTYRLPRIAKLNAQALNPVRSFLRYCHFNSTKCMQGLNNLKKYSFSTIYSSGINSEMNYLCTDIPEKHGDHLHACDAFRYVAYSQDIWSKKVNNSMLNNMLHNHRQQQTCWTASSFNFFDEN